ncbi:MAG: hypothetical protein ACFFCQ_12805 [Promethearchaeota archaeon]
MSFRKKKGKGEVEQLKFQIVQLDAEKSELHQQIAELTETAKCVREKARIEQLANELITYEDEIKELKKQVSGVRGEDNMEVDNIKKALADCDSEKTALNIKFDNLKEEKVTLESQIYEIQSERDELQKKLDSEKDSCLKANQMVSELELEKEELIKQLDACKSQNEVFRKKIEQNEKLTDVKATPKPEPEPELESESEPEIDMDFSSKFGTE